MRRNISVVVLAMVLPVAFAWADNKEPQENVDETIRYLLDYVAKSDCTFIRNGTAYDGKKASEHLESKYKYFKKEIVTPEDFIRLAATKSLLTGKPYMIKTKDGTELRSDDWLKKILEDYRKTQKEKKEKDRNG